MKNNFISVGKILNFHGVKGEAKFGYSKNREEFLSKLETVYIQVNNEYREALEKGGMCLSGMSPDGRIVEMIEFSDHPFFVATQAHPEFKSRPDQAHPLFDGLVAAAIAREG